MDRQITFERGWIYGAATINTGRMLFGASLCFDPPFDLDPVMGPDADTVPASLAVSVHVGIVSVYLQIQRPHGQP